jgi:hypothetical protein
LKSFAVVGSRSLVDKPGAEQKCLDIINAFVVEDEDLNKFISGGAKGPDSWGERVAKAYDIQCVIYKPDWAKYGQGAGFRRNELIIQDADIVLVFWDGYSGGTAHDIQLCKQYNVPFIIYLWKWNTFTKQD